MLISIITATFNADKYLERLIKSTLCQLTEDIEFIIIDGKSNDKTVNIIKKYKLYISYWISETDKGIYDAWNKGLKVAKGEWIMFIGADDLLKADAIKRYIQFIQKNNTEGIDYICSKNEYLSKEGTVIKIIGQPFIWKSFKYKMNVAHVASLHHRNLFSKNGFFDTNFRICADYEFFLRTKGRLNSLFLDSVIASMSSGGASFSVKAIKEAYLARKKTKTLSILSNIIMYVIQLLLFYRFRLIHIKTNY